MNKSAKFVACGSTPVPASPFVCRTHRTAAPSPAVAGFRPAGLALAVAAALMGMGSAFGQPTGAQAIQGQALLKQQGTSLVVTTQNAPGTNRSVINWQSFSVPAGSTTRFDQPTAQSLSINRVVGNDPSAIYGTLSSNGRLVLVNPFGIAVGAGAVVDTAGFTASTLKMSDADALAGRLRFTGDGTAGALSVNGNIIGRGGDVVLIAPNVNTGAQAVIQAQGGSAILAAGQSVEVTGRGLEGIVMQVQAPENQAVNLGTLQGDAVGIFAGTLRHSGLIQANAVSTEGGKVVLKAQGDALVDGQISAKAGDKGGSVDVLGNRVGLMAGAAIDASGPAGGGTVRVGGDFHGANPDVPNAQRTYVDPSATIHADATQSGDGGKVAVWADDQTQGYGMISARGGPQGGDGGLVEVSGKQKLAFGASVDTSAAKGKLGTLLLDPDTINIDTAGTDPYSGPIAFADSPGVTLSLNPALLDAQHADIVLEATNAINVNSALALTTAGKGFSATAGGTIAVNAPITTTAGAVYLSAGDPLAGTLAPSDGALYIRANIDTTGGGVASGANITLKSGKADLGGNSVYINGPTLNAGSAGAVQVHGLWVDVLTAGIHGGGISVGADSGNITLNSATLMATGGSDISLNAGSGAALVSYSTLSSTGGAISIQAGQAVAPTASGGIRIDTSTLDAGAGTIALDGTTASPFNWGVDFVYGGTSLAAGGGTTVTGTNVGSSLSVGAGGVRLTEDGLLTVHGPLHVMGTATDAWGKGVVATWMTLTSDSAVSIEGTGGYTGVDLSGLGTSISIASGGLSVSGNSVNIDSAQIAIADNSAVSIGAAGGGLSINATTVTTNGGTLNLGGSTGGLYVSGSALSAGAASLSGQWVNLNTSSVTTSGGAVSIAAAAGAYASATTIATGGGNVAINGGLAIESNGVSIVNGSALQAGTGNIDIGGQAHYGRGVYIDGSALSAANVAIAGTSTLSSGWSAVELGSSTITGSSSLTIVGAAFPASGSTGVSLGSSTLSAGNSLTLASLDGDLSISGSQIRNAGPGPMSLHATSTSGASRLTIDAASSVQQSGGADLTLAADSMTLQGSIGSGPGRTLVAASSPSRAISIGGIDDGSRLTLDPSALAGITAGTLVIGSGSNAGGLSVEAALVLANAPALSLVQALPGTITQMANAPITAGALNAEAGSVSLLAANAVQTISGRAYDLAGTGFGFSNAGGTDLTVGTVDGIAGILSGSGPTSRAGIRLDVPKGQLLQTAFIGGGLLTASASGGIMLTDADLEGVSASSAGGNIRLVNANTGSANLSANAQGAISYTGAGAVVIDSVAAASAAAGNSIGSAAISLQAASIAAGAGAVNIAARSGGSVVLNAMNGDIGTVAKPLAVSGASAVYASAAGTGDVHLGTPDAGFHIAKLSAAGNASLTGSGASVLGLDAATVGGTLGWTGFTAATLGSGNGMISAAGAITAAGNVILAGTLDPGGSGGISSMTISGGDFTVLPSATLKFDLVDTTHHDQISVVPSAAGVGGNVHFAGSSSVVLAAAAQPPAGTYTLIAGTTSGLDPLPAVSGNVSNVKLAWGSLLAQVGPTVPLVDQIAALLGGDQATAQQVLAQLDTNPLTTFTTLVLQEKEKQSNGQPASDDVVATTICKP